MNCEKTDQITIENRMLLLSLLQLSVALKISTTYIGNVTRINETTDDPAAFQIAMALAEDANFSVNLSMEVFQGVSRFRNSSEVELPFNHIYSMYGFQDRQNSSFYFFGLPKPSTETAVFTANVSDQLDDFDTFYDNVYEIHEKVQQLLENMTTEPEFLSLVFQVSETEPQTEPYRLPFNFSGIAISENTTVSISAWMFDSKRFICEGRMYGVLTAVGVVLMFYAWASISRASHSSLTKLSLHSYIMHMGFDFSYGLFLFNIALSYSWFRDLFMILFTAFLLLYFTLQITFISNQWKAAVDIGELPMDQIRVLFLQFFSELALLMFISLFSVVVMIDMPFIPLLFLYSSFIPQIIHSCKRSEKKNCDTAFTILTTINKIMILWYIYGYDYAIYGVLKRGYAIFFTVYALAQMIIVLLQNKFGGSFFLPKKYRRNLYNYFGHDIPANTECSICMTEIEAGDNTMLTPCQHAYHKECLERWMQEQMVCPICRARLPVVDESDGETNVYN